jgi:hypothetical protein
MIQYTAEDRDFARLLADYLEGLKDTEASQAGTHSSFATSSLRFFVLTSQWSRFVAWTIELAAARKALSEEKAAWSATDQALVEEKATRQVADQSLLSSNEDNTLLAREIESTWASLTTTTDKLFSKSSAPDHAVIQEQQMKIRLTAWEEKLTTCEEKLTMANDKLKPTKEKMKT